MWVGAGRGAMQGLPRNTSIDQPSNRRQHRSMTATGSILPQELTIALTRIGSRLEQQLSVEPEIVGVLALLNELPPDKLLRTESEIRAAASLYQWRRQAPLIARLFSPMLTDLNQLKRVAGLEYLFVFHGDGYVREAALQKMNGELPSALMFAAVAWRLNDWAAPVRKAAVKCADRTFKQTSADKIAEAALSLLTREMSWGRWNEERSILEDAFARPDVVASVADVIATRRTGAMAKVLRHAMRADGFDTHLDRIARDAVQPAVRAIAVQSLIDGFVKWPDGWHYRWIDKSLGIRRREITYRQRELTVSSQRDSMIIAGIADRATVVRNVALTALIRYRLDTDEARNLARPLLLDRSKSVRERAGFILQEPVQQVR